MGDLTDLAPDQQRDSFVDALRPHLSAEALEAVEVWAQERVVEGDREALGLPRRLTAVEEAMEKVLPRVEAVENGQPDNAYRRKVKDGHHQEQTIEGMDDQVSAGFGYQLDATEGIDLTRGSWPNNLRLTLSGAGSVGPFCFDYLVQPGWTGTEGKEFTFQDSTSSFIIYSTVAAAVSAASTAASTSGVRTIMVCSSITEGEIDIGGLGTSASLVITSVDRYRVVITGGANEDLFDQDSNGGNIGGRLVFRNIGLAPATGKAVLDINTADEVLVLAFENCDFPADPGRAYLVRQDGGDRLQNIKLRVKHCTGALAGFYQVGGNGVTFSPDSLEGFDNILALTAWWDGGAANAAPSESVRVQGGFYTITNGITTMADGPDEFHWSELFINFAGNEALFTSPAASDTGNDWSFKNIILRTTHVDGVFLKLEGGTAQAPHDNIYIHNIFGYSTVSPSGTFITVDLDLTNVHVSDIHAPEWATLYSGPPITPSPAPPHLDFFNGTFVETLDADISEAGGVVTLSLQQEGTGDLTMRFSDGFSILDCTPAATIALTVGSDTSPQANYIYVPQSTKVLTKSTTQWPATEHIKVGYYLIPSAAFVSSNGPYIQQQWNDHRMGTDNMGHMAHMAERERLTRARYFSGIDPNGATSYLTIVGATVDYKSTSGVIFQMHRHASPAVDTSAGDEVLIVNWPGVEGAFHNITNLFDIVEDSGGNTIGNNKWFNLVIWGVANKSGTYEPAMINLPAGFYNTQASAEQDISALDNFDLPREFDLESSTAFLIARLTVQKQAGTWAFGSAVDLRRGDLLGARGGASSPETEFADNALKVFNVTDNSKVFRFLADQIAAATERTITVPDEDVALVAHPSDRAFVIAMS